MTTVDRAEINRALAKAIAYRDCGKPDDAAMWASKLIQLLGAAHILAPGFNLDYAKFGVK